MEKQRVFDEISKLNLADIKDNSLKNILKLMLNLIEDQHQEIFELKKVISPFEMKITD